MAFQQNGYAIIPQSVTYNEWRQYCLTHGIDVDFLNNNQCVDSPKLLWYQYGLRLETGNGYAYGIWLLKRDQNARPPFVQISNINDVKRGDCIVFNRAGSFYTGHIGFADEDYNGSGTITVLGQNQGQGISSGTPSNIVRMSVANFLGAFRNTKWVEAPPEPPSIDDSKTKGFPWALYARKFRHRR